MTVLTYPNNIVGHIFVSWLHPFKEHRIVVIGTKGMLSFEDSSATKDILFYEKGVDWINGEPVSRDGSTEVIPYEKSQPLAEELKYFMSNFDGGEIKIASARNAVEVLEVLETASASLLGASAATPSSANTPDPQPVQDFFVHHTSFVDENVEIGSGTKIWHFSHVHKNAKIGSNCSLGQNVNVGNNVRIGNGVKIQNNVSVYEGVELEDFVFCGPSMVFTNINTPRSKYPQRGSEFYSKTLVKEGASIGANATIVCGNTVGRHALISAGAVVTKDVPDYALMMGVPARRKGWVCECGQILEKPTRGMVACARCNRSFSEADDRLVEVTKEAAPVKEAV
jgi:UDP-2-acetamido-3-amino-2,3-dideoxy-glucuronate N-acetyltransferase